MVVAGGGSSAGGKPTILESFIAKFFPARMKRVQEANPVWVKNRNTLNLNTVYSIPDIGVMNDTEPGLDYNHQFELKRQMSPKERALHGSGAPGKV